MRYIVPVGIVLTLCCCVSTQGAWDEANRQGTIAAYEQFLRVHPTADEAGQARARLRALWEDKRWSNAAAINTIEGYKVFLSTDPDSKYAPEAKQRLSGMIADRDWKAARAANTAAALGAFLKDHGTSQYAAEARERFAALSAEEEARAWKAAQAANTSAAFEAFLKSHGASQYASKAAERRDTLREEEQRRLWKKVQQAMNDAAEWKAVPVRQEDYAKNITIVSPSSVLVYLGALVSSPGTPHALIPSKGKVWQPIDGTTFSIKRIKDIPLDWIQSKANVVAYSAQGTFQIGYVFTELGTLTIAVPREILPCEIEIQGLLKERVQLKK